MAARTRLSINDRLRLCKRVYEDGVSVAQASREFGVSRFTFYKLSRRFVPGAADEVNRRLIADRYRKDLAHPKHVSSQKEREVLELVRKNPRLSTRQIASRVAGIGNHGVQIVLAKLDIHTREDREAFACLSQEDYKKALRWGNVGVRRFFTPQERLALVRRVVDNKERVAAVCRQAGISRITFYQWLKRYQEDPSLAGQVERWASGKRHNRAVPESIEQRILSIVTVNPYLSSRKLVQRISGVSNHGVENVLKRHSLNTLEKRLAYTQS